MCSGPRGLAVFGGAGKKICGGLYVGRKKSDGDIGLLVAATVVMVVVTLMVMIMLMVMMAAAAGTIPAAAAMPAAVAVVCVAAAPGVALAKARLSLGRDGAPAPLDEDLVAVDGHGEPEDTLEVHAPRRDTGRGERLAEGGDISVVQVVQIAQIEEKPGLGRSAGENPPQCGQCLVSRCVMKADE